MVRTNSTMLPLGTRAPDFTLTDTAGRTVAKADYAERPLLVMFICNHCPYVKHVADELARLGRDYGDRVGIVAIQSNDVDAYPDDDLEHMKREKESRGYTFPYLLDESQQVAKAYTAACTPDYFLFDAGHRLAYRGQLDDSRPKQDPPTPVTGRDLRTALDTVLSGRDPDPQQRPSMGCNIKWKPGHEPEYFASA